MSSYLPCAGSATEAEARLTAVLAELGLTDLVTSITGLSAVGAAAILAETGDPRRFTSGRALARHAGLAPREKISGSYTGRSRTTGQGRPALRLAAWRAVWGALKSNPACAARFTYLTSREHTSYPPARRTPRSLPLCCVTCTPSSPPASGGNPP